MASAAAIIKKVSSILRKVGPPARLTYRRTTVRAAYDALIGVPGTVTYTDTLLAPQPYYTRLGRDRVPGGHTKSEDAIVGDGSVRLLDDYLFYLSPEAITLETIQDPDFTLVLKSPPTIAGTITTPAQTEVFKLIDMDPAMIYGEDVLFSCYMRSIQRP